MATDSRFQAFTRTHQRRADEPAVIVALLLAGRGRESKRDRANHNRPKWPLMPRGAREARLSAAFDRQAGAPLAVLREPQTPRMV